jgi:hypothetical protein
MPARRRQPQRAVLNPRRGVVLTDPAGNSTTVPFGTATQVLKGDGTIGTPPPATPTAHKTSHQNGGSDELNVGGLNGELADPQPPKTHASSHQNGGGDEVTVTGLSGELADPQPPKTHKASHENAGGDELSVAGLSGELADPQPPKLHAASHADGGSDELSITALADWPPAPGVSGSFTTVDGKTVTVTDGIITAIV